MLQVVFFILKLPEGGLLLVAVGNDPGHFLF